MNTPTHHHLLGELRRARRAMRTAESLRRQLPRNASYRDMADANQRLWTATGDFNRAALAFADAPEEVPLFERLVAGYANEVPQFSDLLTYDLAHALGLTSNDIDEDEEFGEICERFVERLMDRAYRQAQADMEEAEDAMAADVQAHRKDVL